jgi:TRAP-type C4-dicarboxylate transport system permease small subunit
MAAGQEEIGMRQALLHGWNSVERKAIGLLSASALGIATYQMIVRYLIPGMAQSWTGEIVIYLLVWAVFLAGSSLVHDDAHVRADLVLRLLPSKSQRPLELFNISFAIIFCLVLTYYGALATLDAWRMDERSISALRFPMWLYYAALPVGVGLMTLRFIVRLYVYLFMYDAKSMSVHSGRES